MVISPWSFDKSEGRHNLVRPWDNVDQQVIRGPTAMLIYPPKGSFHKTKGPFISFLILSIPPDFP